VGRDGEIYRGDLVSEKQKYFCKWDWTGRKHEPSLICPSGKISPLFTVIARSDLSAVAQRAKAEATKQSTIEATKLDCFASLAMTV
jgi:hypothetical protein